MHHEWEVLKNLKRESFLDFEALWERAHRSMAKAGLLRTLERDIVAHFWEVGETLSRAIRRDRRSCDGRPCPRGAKTRQDARVVACEAERRQTGTEATRHGGHSRSGATSNAGAYQGGQSGSTHGRASGSEDRLDGHVPPHGSRR